MWYSNGSNPTGREHAYLANTGCHSCEYHEGDPRVGSRGEGEGAYTGARDPECDDVLPAKLVSQQSTQ